MTIEQQILQAALKGDEGEVERLFSTMSMADLMEFAEVVTALEENIWRVVRARQKRGDDPERGHEWCSTGR